MIWQKRPRSPRHVYYALAYSFLLLILDQFSKWMILEVIMRPPTRIALMPFVDFVLVWNRGVTFGLLSHHEDWTAWALSGLALAVVGLLLTWLWRTDQRLQAAAIGVIIGGAIGNVIDRLRFGAVVDFISLQHYPWVFNVADSAVVIGVGLLLWDSWRQTDTKKPTQ
jgi:signal peptidase II